MQITITLSETAAMAVSQYVETCGVTISGAVSNLIERSVQKKSRIKYVDGIPVFDVPEDGGMITTEDIKRLEADEM